jgi:hypothetical protein
MKAKTFDCVEMKRAAQRKIRAAIAGRDHSAEIKFFRTGADEFEQRIQDAKAALPQPDAPAQTGSAPSGSDA